jgi:hypothetical protein
VGFQEQELKKEMGENREKNTDWIAVSTSPRYYRHTLRPDQPLDHANADANMSKRHRQRCRRFFFGNSLPPKWLGDFFLATNSKSYQVNQICTAKFEIGRRRDTWTTRWNIWRRLCYCC